MPKVNRALALFMSALIVFAAQPAAFAGDKDSKLNFKIYNPDAASSPDASSAPAADSPATTPSSDLGLTEETPTEDKVVETPKETPSTTPETEAAPTTAATESDTTSAESTATGSASQPIDNLIDPAIKDAGTTTTDTTKKAAKPLLQGKVSVVPQGTKIPIIMDTAVDSDTSQEGDEFAARTSEDLNIDGQITVPAGSIIKGRIARITLPRMLNRSGHVALKFDTVTTPDNKQIPIVANLVARGGVVHAKRGLKDIAIDVGAVTLPTGVGLGIGLIAGASSSSSSIGAGGGALIGAGVGVAIGCAILLSKKGKRVDVRPGDELKIELAEELQMPTM